MRLLGIDYGKARIGIAISDEEKIIATPLETIKNQKDYLDIILNLIKEKNVEKTIIGLPLLMSGKDSDFTTEVREFAKKIKTLSNIEVVLWDERLTSKEVEKFLISEKIKRKKRAKLVDSMSAVLILQSYLNYDGNK